MAVPALQTNVPVTAVTGPGVPLELLPLRTKPSTSNECVPVGKVHACVPIANRPRARTRMDTCNWIVNGRSGNHADDAVPAHDCSAFDPGKCRCGAQGQGK